MALLPGRRLGPYEIVAPVGAGGMGEVYRARDTRLQRDVALKVLAPEMAADPDRLRRFELEARAVAALNHPNILAIYDVGAVEEVEEAHSTTGGASHLDGGTPGAPFLVTELLEGSTLRERLDGRGLPARAAVDLAVQIAQALAAAHGKGVIHRDLKPENIFVTKDGRVKVLDFGLAKMDPPLPAGDDTLSIRRPAVTNPGTVMGTAAYMSPEQARGLPADNRSDIFSFGVVLYEMLAGKNPFRSESSADTLASILREDPAPLPPVLPHSLERIVRHCLEKRPEDRFQSAGDLSFQLQSLWTTPPLHRETEAVPLPKRIMLVVLPFDNSSQDPEREYFSDGLTVETISDLGMLASDRLGVIARTSAMSYKGTRKSIAEIGRELEVDYALEGSVRRHGDLVRINVQLIRTSDQTHLWAGQYNRELKDFLTVQDELGRAIAEQVKIRLTPAESARRTDARPLNQAAYDTYLQGRFHLWKVNRPNLERAIQFFQKAVEHDPGLAVAHAGLAQALIILTIAADAPPRETFPQAERAAMQALEIDACSAEAHSALASIRFWHHWDWAAGEAHFRRAFDHNPSYSRAHMSFGRMLTIVGRHDEAIAEGDRARELDPLSPLIHAMCADFRFQAGRPEEVQFLIRRAKELDPKFWYSHLVAAKFFVQEDRCEEALAAAEKARDLSGGISEPLSLIGYTLCRMGRRNEAEQVLFHLHRNRIDRYVSAYNIATVYLGLGDAEQVITWLERAYKDRDICLLALGTDPRWDALRSHSSFEGLIRRIGL